MIAAIAGAVALVMYREAGKETTAVYGKLGDLMLQISLVVVATTLLKLIFVDWRSELQARLSERESKRIDFLTRMREVHVTVAIARERLLAHGSPKTYSEELQTLMKIRFKLEDLVAEMEASRDIFSDSKGIVDSAKQIVSYLKEAGEEYIAKHDHVDPGGKQDKANFKAFLSNHNPEWVSDLLKADERYKKYEAALDGSKGKMRTELYGTEAS